MYIQIRIMHVKQLISKRGRGVEKEQGGVYWRLWKKESEGQNDVFIL